MQGTMTTDHPRWDEFIVRLKDQVVIPDDLGKVVLGEWPVTRAILKSMGFEEFEIESSLDFFNQLGGDSDYFVLLHVQEGVEIVRAVWNTGKPC